MNKRYSIEEIKPKIWYKAISNDDPYMQPWYNYFFEIGEAVEYFSIETFDLDEYDANINIVRENNYEFTESLDSFNFEKIKINDKFRRYLLLSVFRHEV